MHSLDKPEFILMQISYETFERFKKYSNRYSDGDCYDDVLNELMDAAENHKTNCL